MDAPTRELPQGECAGFRAPEAGSQSSAGPPTPPAVGARNPSLRILEAAGPRGRARAGAAPSPPPSPGGGAREALTSRGARWQHLPAR